MISINERIRLILDRSGIDNIVVAGWLGMTNSRMSQKFKGGIWDSVAELRVIAEKTGVDLDWLITGKGEPNKNTSSNLVNEPQVEYYNLPPETVKETIRNQHLLIRKLLDDIEILKKEVESYKKAKKSDSL